MSWQDHIQHLDSENSLESAAFISRDGTLLGSNFGISELPSYEIDVSETEKASYNEKAMLVRTIYHAGNSKHEAGLRINNQKYYTAEFSEQNKVWYLVKASRVGGACVAFTNSGNMVFGSYLGKPFENPQIIKVQQRIIEYARYLSSHGF